MITSFERFGKYGLVLATDYTHDKGFKDKEMHNLHITMIDDYQSIYY